MTRLIKIGSALISPGNRIDHRFLQAKSKEIAELIGAGDRVLVVSSGAVAAGMEVSGLEQRPRATLDLQLLSGIGQARLMKYYRDYFKAQGLQTAQVLLTHYNFDSSRERDTVGHILRAYLDRRVVPVINENDLVDKEELEHRGHFTDNDILAALVAERLRVDQALLLTDVDGLLRSVAAGDTTAGGHAGQLVQTVTTVDDAVRAMASGSSNGVGLGGMYSKIAAAERMMARGIEVIVGNGRLPLHTLLTDPTRRTLFQAAAVPARVPNGTGGGSQAAASLSPAAAPVPSGGEGTGF